MLVVDDDPRTLRFVREALDEAGYAPLATGEHRALGQLIAAERPCLVLLDLMLAGADGIELLESVPELADQPVIFISAYGRDETIAKALERGAADYLVKPFSATELVARVRAALRRRAEPEPFVLGELAIHYAERRVSVAGRAVRLTAIEYELLRLLSANAGRVLAYDAADPPALEQAGRHGRPRPGAHLREAAPAQARRRSGVPGLHLQRSAGSATACRGRAPSEGRVAPSADSISASPPAARAPTVQCAHPRMSRTVPRRPPPTGVAVMAAARLALRPYHAARLVRVSLSS